MWKLTKLPRMLSGYSMQVQPDQEAVTNEKGVMPALYTAFAARGKLLSRRGSMKGRSWCALQARSKEGLAGECGGDEVES
eukprot:1642167-Pleurochrysis_carterae.AAC.2